MSHWIITTSNNVYINNSQVDTDTTDSGFWGFSQKQNLTSVFQTETRSKEQV